MRNYKSGCIFGRLLKKLFKIAFITFGVLFAIFWFDLDGKFLYYIVEPFLKKHYDNMERKDTLGQPYDIGKYRKPEYDT